jgi:hypothetical protein
MTKLQQKALEAAKALYAAGHGDDTLGNELMDLCAAAAREKGELLQVLKEMRDFAVKQFDGSTHAPCTTPSCTCCVWTRVATVIKKAEGG